MPSLYQRRISTKCVKNGFDINFCDIKEPIALQKWKDMCHSQYVANTRCETKNQRRHT